MKEEHKKKKNRRCKVKMVDLLRNKKYCYIIIFTCEQVLIVTISIATRKFFFLQRDWRAHIKEHEHHLMQIGWLHINEKESDQSKVSGYEIYQSMSLYYHLGQSLVLTQAKLSTYISEISIVNRYEALISS